MVAIRVDASSQMGVGHVMRCISLAEILRARGTRVRFVCKEHPGHLAGDLRQRSYDVSLLPPPTSTAADEDYASWLGGSQAKDAQQTTLALQGEDIEWLIVDHYALDQAWESVLRAQAGHVLAIDDLANRRHDCDLLVDQNFSESPGRYRGLLPDACRPLLGPYFAMLRPEYRLRRGRPRERDGQVRRILIFFGGSDPLNLTGRAIEALDDVEFQDAEVDVVVGVNNPHRQSLHEAAARRPRTHVHGPQPHLADLMARADLSIGAGGVTTWERMCVGLPAIIVSIAENQRPACESLAEAGLIVYAGHCTRVSVQDLKSALRRTFEDRAALVQMSSGGQRLVDGWGTLRIVETMLPTAKSALKLRPAGPEDMQQYFVWANDPEVRAQSIQTEAISLDDHRRWFARKLGSSESKLFVLQAGDLPVGQIRFDREGSEERIDYSIERIFRGRGWAARLVALGMAQVPRRHGMYFRAEVKPSNLASRSVFLRLGFEMATSEQGGLTVFRLSGDQICES
jgi:UDP-2,4-diacetamido-2,4,6-trideoxy-beta-L-altropyranose hydrolase